MSGGETAPKLRFAVLCRGTPLPPWQAKCIGHLLESGIAELSLLIVAPSAKPPLRERMQGLLLSAAQLAPVCAALRGGRRTGALRPLDLAAGLPAVPSITCATEGNDGSRPDVSPEEVAAVRAKHLDFILSFADGAPADGLLAVARFGVWTFGEERDRRQAIWRELYGDEPAHRVCLWRLAGSGRGTILHTGAFRRQRSVRKALGETMLGSADWCARVCRQIARGDGAARFSAAPSLPLPRPKPPTRRERLRFFLSRLAALPFLAFRRCFLLEYWSIGIAEATVARLLAAGRPPPVRWLTSSRDLRYCADPFALPEQSDTVLVEEYSHLLGKGWISWLRLGDGSDPQPIAAFERPTHLSYPYLLVDGGTVFCIPETAEQGCVELYRALRFPDRWEHAATLLRRFPALDSTVLRHEGRWWLFCSSSEEGGEHKLYAWHAETLYGPWVAHAQNPLKCDPASSRPAGRPFVSENRLYRPAQDCSRTYGGAITINEVITLTATAFDEIPVRRIAPDPDGGYPDGIHTLCPVGERIIFDGKRFVFDPRAPYLKLRAAIRSRRAAAERRPAAAPQRLRTQAK